MRCDSLMRTGSARGPNPCQLWALSNNRRNARPAHVPRCDESDAHPWAPSTLQRGGGGGVNEERHPPHHHRRRTIDAVNASRRPDPRGRHGRSSEGRRRPREESHGAGQRDPGVGVCLDAGPGVRSTGEVFQHIAADNYFMPVLLDKPAPKETGVTKDYKTALAFEKRPMNRRRSDRRAGKVLHVPALVDDLDNRQGARGAAGRVRAEEHGARTLDHDGYAPPRASRTADRLRAIQQGHAALEQVGPAELETLPTTLSSSAQRAHARLLAGRARVLLLERDLSLRHFPATSSTGTARGALDGRLSLRGGLSRTRWRGGAVRVAQLHILRAAVVKRRAIQDLPCRPPFGGHGPG